MSLHSFKKLIWKGIIYFVGIYVKMEFHSSGNEVLLNTRELPVYILDL